MHRPRSSGLDLSRKRLDWQALSADGTLVGAGAVPPDPDGLAQLVHRLSDADVLAVVESIDRARARPPGSQRRFRVVA